MPLLMNLKPKKNRMKRRTLKLLACAAITIILTSACTTVAFTGRQRMLFYDDHQITALSDQSYTAMMDTVKVSTDPVRTAMVKEVGKRLTSSLDKYLKETGQESLIEDLSWDYTLVKSNEVNAFCMPNGKIVFYEGIMKVANTPDFVAVVMGHEMAHAIARHGNERLSQQMALNLAGSIASEIIGIKGSQVSQALFETAFGLGSQYGLILPFSRKHEYEADKIGLILMAMAGYDLNQAPAFWEKMLEADSRSMPEWLSTHPTSENRIKKIRKNIPEALKYAK